MLNDAPVKPDFKKYLNKKNLKNLFKIYLLGELIDDGVERRASPARGRRRQHSIGAERQPPVCHFRPLHDLVTMLMMRMAMLMTTFILFRIWYFHL